MRIGITGATGHIGFVICKELIKQKQDVIAFIRKKNKHLEKLSVTEVFGDVTIKEEVEAFVQQCDVIIHTAAQIGLGYKSDKNLYNTNVIGTRNVLELSLKYNVKKVICFSSIHAFKQAPYDVPLNESRAFVDNNSVYYDQTKREVFTLTKEYAQKGLNVITLAPTSVIGTPDYRPSKIGKAIIDIYKGKIPMMLKGGFDFVDVKDIAQATISSIDKGKTGEIYILGGKYHTIKELSDLILEAKGVKRRLVVVPDFMVLLGLPFVKLFSLLSNKPPLYDKVYLDILKDGNPLIDTTKAKEELDFNPRPLKETIEDYINWYKQ